MGSSSNEIRRDIGRAIGFVVLLLHALSCGGGRAAVKPTSSPVLTAYKKHAAGLLRGESGQEVGSVDIDGTASADPRALALVAADRTVRVLAPAMFDLVNLPDRAKNLRQLAPIVDMKSARDAFRDPRAGLNEAYLRKREKMWLGFFGSGERLEKADRTLRLAATALFDTLAMEDASDKEVMAKARGVIELTLDAAAIVHREASWWSKEEKKAKKEADKNAKADKGTDENAKAKQIAAKERDRILSAPQDLLRDLVAVARGKAPAEVAPVIDPGLLAEDCSQPQTGEDGKPDYAGCLSKMQAEARYEEIVSVCEEAKTAPDTMDEDRLHACYPLLAAALYLEGKREESREVVESWCYLKPSGSGKKPGRKIRKQRAAEVTCLLVEAYKAQNAEAEEKKRRVGVEDAITVYSEACKVRRRGLSLEMREACQWPEADTR